MGTKVGGSPTGKMRWPKPHDKTPGMKSSVPAAKGVAAGSNEDHRGGYPKGKLRGAVGGIK